MRVKMRVKNTGAIGFSGLLTIVFITLKLCKVINWSWVLVLSPFWITTGVGAVLLTTGFLILGIKTYRQIKLKTKIEKIFSHGQAIKP